MTRTERGVKRSLPDRRQRPLHLCHDRPVDPGRASVTAMATALMRADHTRGAQSPLIDDPWGDRLVPEAYRERLRQGALSDLPPEAVERLEGLSPEQLLAVLLRAHPSYATIIIRTRYAEDALAAAVARGVRQFVIVGAGLDSFGLRRPPFARGVQVFEIDHPDTQSFKLGRLTECGLSAPPEVHFIAADLGTVAVDEALDRSPFDPAQPSFFSWLGVTAYLTREANLRTLRAIAACGAPGSELVFDYGDQRAYDVPPTDAAIIRARLRVARAGEPWISGFHPAELEEVLRAVGLELVENLSPQDLGERYCRAEQDGLRPSPSHHLARARPAR
jgi:methyltransferase (TIGR00027 family)